MTLTDFYEYIFGDKALIKFDKRIESDESLKNKILEKREKEIRGAFQCVTDPSNNVHKKFLNLLSALQTPGSNSLKELLYTQEQSLLPSNILSEIRNPYDSEHIKLIFKNENRTFKYFPEEDNQAENDFVIFFVACKLMSDFVECNNDDENTLVSDLAYKMLVAFGAGHEKKQHLLANVETYLREHANKESKHPIHDALTQAIPVNDPPLNDLNGWRRLIRTYGYKALEFFQEAPAIEKLTGKAPDTIDEAEKIASKLSYQRVNEYPELALFCKRYHINEAVFNKCLEIEKHRKKSDNLPNVQINGADVSKECEGYHLVKLPIDDPRAYILGNITNCCQSVGGASEKCVIDGITRENNGFYVLLKQKRKPYINKPPLIKGHIDDASYDIVGQGYAWLSTKGNMVFDSWENLRPESDVRPESDDKIVVPLLEKFAQEVTDKTENILRVTIGRGGRSPSYFKRADKIVSHPEVILEGVQYKDSQKQGLIYLNESKCLNILQKNGLLHHDDLQRLQGDKNIYNLLSALSILHEANPALINDETRQLLGAHTEHSISIASALLTLHRTNPALINDEICQLLGAHAQHSSNIASALSTLHQTNPALINDENRQLLSTHAEHSGKIAAALSILYRRNPALINNENFQLLGAHAEYSARIAYDLSTLHKTNPALINDETRQLLSTHAKHSGKIASALCILHYANPALINDETRQLLGAHAEHSENIASALSTLHYANPALINNETRQLLATHAANVIATSTQLVNMFNLVSDSNASRNLTSSSNQHHLFTQNPSSMDEIYKKIKKFLLGDKSINFNKNEITSLEKVNFQSNYNQVFKSLPVVEALENENKNETPRP